MPDVHAKVTPSGSKKWLNCTKSVQLESLIPQGNTKYTTEGTEAHAVCESLLKKSVPNECNSDMLSYCEGYRDYCVEQTNRIRKSRVLKPTTYVETKLDLSSYIPDGFGTVDYMAISDGVLIIIDFKYGKGVEVSAQNNTQLMIYALGALDMLDFIYDVKTVEMHIYQPRLDNIDVFAMSADKIRNFGDVVKVKSKMAYNGEGDCVAGSHCVEGFCRARGSCKAFAEYNLQIEAYEFKSLGLLTPTEIGSIIKRAENLESWVKSVKDYALAQALNGETIEGFKLVKGRGRRVVTNDDTAIELLKSNGYDDCTTTKLKGITELEKLVGKKQLPQILGSYIQMKEGSPTLAPLADKRAEYVINSAELDFKYIQVD